MEEETEHQLKYVSIFDHTPRHVSGAGASGACRSVTGFTKLNRVGEGTYGVVYRARDEKDGNIVALKKLRIDQRTEGISISSFREINLLMDVRHENIVRLYEVVIGPSAASIFLVMEFCEQDLACLLDHMKVPFSEAQVKCILQQLLRALRHLHDMHIIHRDIKVSNLLMTHQGIVKLGDFGLAREIGEGHATNLTPDIVTLWYRSPEVLFGDRRQTAAIDIWATACIFGELLVHRPLLPGKGDVHQIALIINLLGTPTEHIWPGFSSLPLMKNVQLRTQPYNQIRSTFKMLNEDGCQLINAMFMYDPARRLSAKDCLRHVYFERHPLPCDPSMMPTFPQHRNR